jgi:hypothetical protein
MQTSYLAIPNRESTVARILYDLLFVVSTVNKETHFTMPIATRVAPALSGETSLDRKIPILPFTPTAIPGQQTFNSKVFPLALILPSEHSIPTVEAGAAYLRSLAASGELTRLLNEHGAILFRGFGHPSAETFSTLVRAAEEGRGSVPFEQIGLAGKRNHLAEEVFTANEGPPERRFYQHNEARSISSTKTVVCAEKSL